MINNPVIFYSASVLITIFALLALLRAMLCIRFLQQLLCFFRGIVFYLLGSEYNAIIQAAIYGLAVPVIVGVSIMFTTRSGSRAKSFITPYITLLCSGIFLLAFIYLVMMSLAMSPDTFHTMELVQVNAFDTIRAFARGIFINYVWAFELVSLLLTIVIAGFGLIKFRKGGEWK